MNFLHICHNYAVRDALLGEMQLIRGGNVQVWSEHIDILAGIL